VAIDCMHDWSDVHSRQRITCSAERLEWILFKHNGGPAWPDASKTAIAIVRTGLR